MERASAFRPKNPMEIRQGRRVFVKPTPTSAHKNNFCHLISMT
jgi:hypothetical protein